jgi:hypothetical protein
MVHIALLKYGRNPIFAKKLWAFLFRLVITPGTLPEKASVFWVAQYWSFDRAV